MKTTTIIFSFLIILFSTGCIYKTPVQQGNILVQKDIDEIKEIANEHLDKIEALLDGDHDKLFQESLFNLAKFSLFRSI